MIEEIRISNLGVIDESVLELGPGLNVITGETGAGKTMLVTALGLLLGSRADSTVVRKGARQARVEGMLRADGDLAAHIDELGGEVEDQVAVLARVVNSEGRSRAFAGGASVPASALGGIAEMLVALHGQSDQHRLLRPEAQLAALDDYGGAPLGNALSAYRAAYEELRIAQQDLHRLSTSARERAQEADGLRAGLEAIEGLAPTPGEDVALALEETRLGSADTLRLAAETARSALSADDGPDAIGAVAAARRALDSIASDDPEAQLLAKRVAELSYLLSDVAADVASYASGLETDPARLAVVSERRAALTALCRKYGDTVDDVLEWARAAAERLEDLEGSDERIAALTRRRDELRAELAQRAQRLSKLRQKSGRRLGKAITGEVRHLSMPHAEVSIAVRRRPDPHGLELGEGTVAFTAHGIDEVEFLLAANGGPNSGPCTRVRPAVNSPG